MDDLDHFYDVVNRGASTNTFLRYHDALFPYIHSNGLTADYRLGKGRLKRLRDEVTPAARFARLHAAPDDQVQFPLNSSVPDCVIRHRATAQERAIEITIAQGRERFHLMTELNATGSGRGFLGLTDDRPNTEFLEAMGKQREMHSTEQAQTTMLHAIALCARNKSHSYGTTLLIEARLWTLPKVRWQELQFRMKQLVEALSFSEIYLIGDRDPDLCIQLK